MQRTSLLLVLLAAVLWGTTGTAQTFAPDGTHPVAFGAMRLAFGGGFLLLFILLKGQLRGLNLPWKGVLLAAACMAFYQPFFFSAVTITGVAIGTVVAIGSAPIIAGMLEWTFAGRRPDRSWWVATTLAVTGCVLLFANSQSVQLDPLGIALALGAGLSFAAYTLVSKSLLQTSSPVPVVAIVFSLSAVLLSPVLFFVETDWLLEWNGVLTVMYLGLFATAVAYLLFAKGLVNIPASSAVTLSLAEPMTAALLGVFLVGEALSLVSWSGVALLLGAIVVLSLPGGVGVRRRGAEAE